MAEIRSKLSQNRFYVMLFVLIFALSGVTLVSARPAAAGSGGLVIHTKSSDLPNMTITCDWGNNTPSKGARKLPRGKSNFDLSGCKDADGYYVPKGCSAFRGSYKGPRWVKISNYTVHHVGLRC